MQEIKRETALLKAIMFKHKIECAIIIAVAVVGLVGFQYVDGISLTAYSVEVWDAVFSGKLLSFQQIFVENMRNAPHGGGGFDGVRFIIFLPWAIWNFPLWLTHTFGANTDVLSLPCLIWSKTFLIVCAILAGIQCYHIVYALTREETQSQLAAIFFWGSGTLAISVGYSMQDEILYILTFLMAIRCYCNKKNKACLAWIIISVTLCPFMILPTLLILLFKYKNLLKVLFYMILCLLPYVLLSKIFPANTPLRDDYADWFFFRSLFNTGYGSVSIFAVVVLIVFALSYFQRYDSIDEENHALLYLLATIMSSICILSWLHFYRYFICIPFLVICLLSIDSKKQFQIKAGLILLTAFEFCRMLGSAFFDRNCLNPVYITEFLKLDVGTVSSLSFVEILKIFMPSLEIDRVNGFIASIIFSLALLLLWLIKKDDNFQIIVINIPMKVISLIYALVPLAIFIVFFTSLFHITIFAMPIEGDDVLAPAITESVSIDQHYYASDGEHVRQVQVRTVTWGQTYPDDLILRMDVIDETTDKNIGSAEIAANLLPNNDYCSFDFRDLQLTSARWYTFRLSAVGTMRSEEDWLCLLHSDDGTARKTEYYVTINDRLTRNMTTAPYNIVSRIIGWK